jgi:hypothetical protein
MNPRQLVDVACKAYHKKLVGGEEATSPKEVGHNIYILCHQLAQHNKELAALMKPPKVNGVSGDAALQYYANHTAQIEIFRHDRTMEQIVFPIPKMCEYLTNDTKVRVFNTEERDDQGSKLAVFFRRRRRDEMAEETTRAAIPLLGQLTHVHLESNSLQLGCHYQLDCRLFLPIRH